LPSCHDGAQNVIHIPSTNPSAIALASAEAEPSNDDVELLPDSASPDDQSRPWGDAMPRFGGLHPGVQAFAYHGPNGGGGGGGGASSATVSKSDLLKEMKGGFVDTKNLSDPLKKALADAGIDPSALTKLADKQGRVSPDKLFAFIDQVDSNRKGGSFDTETVDASGSPVQTKAGALYEALKKEVDANRAVADSGSSAKEFGKLAAGHGVLDVNHLGAAVTKALGGAVSRADLAAIAGADGQIKGTKEFAALHALLDKADGRVDGIASGKLRNADGSVSDSASAPALRAIQDEVAANRKLPQYAQPGTAAASTQTRLTVDASAMTVDPKDQKPVDLKMKGVDQFSLYPDDRKKGGKACFQAAVKACTDHNAKEHGKEAPKLNGPDAAIQIAYAEDGGGRVAIDQTQSRIGRAYIDKALDAGYPAVIGVSYSDMDYNDDQMTDHFVTVDKRGYDDQNRLYYEFKDPGAGGRTGRLYVDETTGKMFKEGDHKGPYVQSADYEVTQVRTYAGVI
jgi:hypothetical protein